MENEPSFQTSGGIDDSFTQNTGRYVYSKLPLALQNLYTIDPILEWMHTPQGREPVFAKHKPGIRVLTLYPGSSSEPILCTLSHEHMFPMVLHPYEALSYAWGDDVNDKVDILCDGKSISITRSLHTALVHLRLPDKPRVLWADGICINQADNAERAEQVKIMPMVYGNADRVLVWLGASSPHDDLAIPFMVHVQAELKDESNTESWSSAKIAASIRAATRLAPDPVATWTSHSAALLDRGYFSRLWVLQEVVVNAQPAIIICGTQTIPWQVFVRCILLRADIAVWLYNGLDQVVYNRMMAHTPMEAVRIMETLRKDRQQTPLDFYDLFVAASALKTSEPRDKIFALLGLPVSGRVAVPPPDYVMSTDEVFHRFVATDVNINKSLLHLSWVGLREKEIAKVHQMKYQTPSWVPAWRGNDPVPVFLINAATRKLSASGTVPVNATVSDDGETLITTGRHVGKVSFLTKRLADLRQELRQPVAEVGIDQAININPAKKLDLYRMKPNAAMLSECLSLIVGAPLSGKYILDGPLERFFRSLAYDWDKLEGEPFKWTPMFRIWTHVLVLLHENKEEMLEILLQDVGEEDMAVIHRQCREKVRIPEEKKFCSLDRGKLGWVPAATQEGDVVVVLDGARVPFVLRPLSEEYNDWELVGECWFDGIMKGEIMEMKDSKEIVFQIK